MRREPQSHARPGFALLTFYVSRNIHYSQLMPTPPLAHLRVIDLTDLRGALAGRFLADLGADVIKIEPPGGDPGRWQPPFVGGVRAPDRSLPFLYRNANKRG